MTFPTPARNALAGTIDHTLLKPTLIRSELEKLCSEAIAFRFKTVCIPPSWVSDGVRLLDGSGVGTITVVGFPLGYSSADSKALEARQAIDQGACEIDMVINLSYLKNNRWSEAEADVARVARECGTIPLKVILETAYLTQAEKVRAALLAQDAGATFIKTSTGFATGTPITGATLEDIRLLRETLAPETRIKASGGIRDSATALAMLQAGADRLGTSNGVAILNGLSAEGEY
jgi:deoxyribose-phosphate aldolase